MIIAVAAGAWDAGTATPTDVYSGRTCPAKTASEGRTSSQFV